LKAELNRPTSIMGAFGRVRSL